MAMCVYTYGYRLPVFVSMQKNKNKKHLWTSPSSGDPNHPLSMNIPWLRRLAKATSFAGSPEGSHKNRQQSNNKRD